MQKNRLSYRRRIIRIPALALFFLGLVCVTWALTNIIQQTDAINQPIKFISYTASTYPVVELTEMSQLIHSSFIVKKIDLLKPDSINKPIAFSEGDPIGNLKIPALDLTLPIFEGTDGNTLKKGVGHFSQSVMPGTGDNCVLSGHRDTVFSKLGKVVVGDLLMIDSASGTFTYQVSDLRIVENDDRTIITPTDHGVLTLTTCYPFQFIGSASQRYIITADLLIAK